MDISDDHQRRIGVLVLLALGATVTAVQVYGVYDDVVSESASALVSVVEVSFPGLLLVAFGGVVVWLYTNDWRGRHVLRVATWSLVVSVAALALQAWVLGIQLFFQNGTNYHVLASSNAAIGLVLGSFIGIYSVMRSRDRRELERSEERYRSLTEDVLDSSDVGIFIVDDDREVVWVNEAVETYFGVAREDVVGRPHADVLSETAAAVADPERFRERVGAMDDVADVGGVDGDGDVAATEERFECRVLPDEDREERWLEYRRRPIESGLYEGGRIEHYTDVTDQTETTAELESRERVLRELHDALLDRSSSVENRIGALMDVGRQQLGTEFAVLTRVDGEDFHVRAASPRDWPLAEGETYPLSDTVCRRVVETERTQQFEHLSRDAPDLTSCLTHADVDVESYVGMPVYADGELYGTLAFYDPEPRPPVGEWEMTVVELMGSWVGSELELAQRRAERQQALRETREQFESLVGDVEEYAIFRLNAAGEVASWNRGARQIKGYEADEVVGEHVRTFYPEAAREDGEPEALLAEARERGRTETEGWRVRKDGSRFWADVSITALREDDGELRGFLKVTRDMTERREREQQLEHERERLEFMNRMIRHNLLNGMNVVEARAGLLSGHVDPEVADHLETVQSRVRDMVDLIETMRSFMQVLTEEPGEQTEPVVLSEVLAAEVEKAWRAYEAVTVAYDRGPDVAVVGNDLLPEVFENLLSNAVQHNDSPSPTVEVSVRVEGDEAVVEVADDGPGIDESMRDALFEKGEKGFESPGTGFGLYLVREIVESYDGSVDARNRPEGGAVFTVRLPLAATTAGEEPGTGGLASE
ncbi:PAS domain S-box protein [Halorubellus sp. JP-L1]|uniref:PAS domain S-box protein n=1 Tax=Halorubellus sp. JP-L1 TaxID=2715753 RepID=UPI00140E06CD|nr:PAS domain S-box protein [Halorubellus sp. JP-L1]NHN43550.1 PAS domain S-box protein [Halorubellus sp. JP-L1]